MKDILEFQDEYRWLSNMPEASFVDDDGTEWSSSEVYYQAQKAIDPKEKEKIRKMESKEAKKYCSKRNKNFKLRENWPEIKIEVMEEALWFKFTQNPDLAKKLMNTGDCKLVEGNYWKDRFWGVCEGEGENNLGILLMKLRHTLQKEYKCTSCGDFIQPGAIRHISDWKRECGPCYDFACGKF